MVALELIKNTMTGIIDPSLSCGLALNLTETLIDSLNSTMELSSISSSAEIFEITDNFSDYSFNTSSTIHRSVYDAEDLIIYETSSINELNSPMFLTARLPDLDSDWIGSILEAAIYYPVSDPFGSTVKTVKESLEYSLAAQDREEKNQK